MRSPISPRSRGFVVAKHRRLLHIVLAVAAVALLLFYIFSLAFLSPPSVTTSSASYVIDQHHHAGSISSKRGTRDEFGYALGAPSPASEDEHIFSSPSQHHGRAFMKSPQLKKRKIRFADVADTKERNRLRKNRVRDEFKLAWKAYERYAWGWDELHPISRSPRSWIEGSNNNNYDGRKHPLPTTKAQAKGWAMTIFDSLDTLWIMGLKDEFRKAVKFLDEEFNIKQDYGLSTFEATIRMLGGSLSAYELSGDPRLLRLASKLGHILVNGLSNKHGMLFDHINFKTGENARSMTGMNLLSEMGGGLQLEFRTLSLHLQDPVFDQKVTHLNSILHSRCGTEEMGFVCPKLFGVRDATPATNAVSFAAMGDSYFEYVVKQPLLTGMTETKLIDMAKTMLHKIVDKYLTTVHLEEDFKFVILHGRDSTSADESHTMDHLSCFAGGMFALAALTFRNETREVRAEWAATGAAITETCYNMYARQPTGLAPEQVSIDPPIRYSSSGVRRGGRGKPPPPGELEFRGVIRRYALRPETLESIFYMSRVDKNTELWRDRGWEIFDSIMTFCRTPSGGYSGLKDVEGLREPLTVEEFESDRRHVVSMHYDDLQQSYAMSELFKYAFLMFQEQEDDDDGSTYIDLEEWVFNTEAHPLRIRQRDPRDVWSRWKSKHGGNARWTAPKIDKVTHFYPELEGEEEQNGGSGGKIVS